MKRWAYAAVALFLVFDAVLLYTVQRGVDEKRKGYSVREQLGDLPKGEYMKTVSLEYDGVVADLLWLRIIQVMGDMKLPPEAADWIFHALDVATDLDLKFDYMYHAGGVFLSYVSRSFELSNRILEKGFRYNPGAWQLPFYIGVNEFLYLGDNKRAAYFMSRAAELPGRPEFVPLLATRLYAEAGDPDYAIDLIGHIYEGTQDEKVRAALSQRMKELVVEKNLNALDKAVASYHERHGRYPASVGQLVGTGLLAAAPTDPLGGAYSVNPETGEVKSSVLPDRLRVFRKRGKKPASAKGKEGKKG